MKPDYIILTGAAISIMGAGLAAFGTLWKSQATSMKQDSLQAKIDTLHEQNERLRNISTGGDSYPTMVIYPGENDSFFVFIRNVGNYPLTFIEFWVTDMTDWNKLSDTEKSQRQIESQRAKVEIKHIRPNSQYGFEGRPFKFDKKIGAYLSVTFSANNGGSEEIIRAKFVKGNWLVAYKNMPDVTSPNPIYEIPEGYPALANKDDTFNKWY